MDLQGSVPEPSLRNDASNVRSITLTWCGLYTFHYCIFFELAWIFTVCLRLTISDRPTVAFIDVAHGEGCIFKRWISMTIRAWVDAVFAFSSE